MANIITNKQLVSFCKKFLGREYWYGCWGNKATEKLLAEKRKQYPKYYDQSAYKKGWTCDGKKVADCCGLLKAALFCNGDYDADAKYCSEQDLSANGMFKKGSTKTGPISTLPEIPGICVWKDGHIGVYIGDGQVIEERGHNFGCVQTTLSSRPWTDWFMCKWIKYEAKRTINVTAIVDGVTYNGNIEEV